jgi:hypothetical protein
LVRSADQQAHDPFGHVRFMETADKEFARRRRLFGRLEHDRIAGDQGGDDVPVGEVCRKIVGPQHRKDPVGLVTHRGPVPKRRFHLPLRRALGIGFDRDLHLVDHGRDLGPGLPKGLSRFARDQLGEFDFLGANHVREPPHRFDSIRMGVRRPGGPRGARRRHFGAGVADLSRPDFLARCRIGRNEHGSLPLADRNRVVNLPVHLVSLPHPYGGRL